MVWEPELDDIARREALAAEMGGLAGRATYDGDGELTGFRASNVLIGTASIARRPVVVVADDFTVR